MKVVPFSSLPFLASLVFSVAWSASPAQEETANAPETTTPSGEEASPRFDIWEYRVFGNTVLEESVIQKTVYPFLGPGRSLEDAEKASQKLQETYHKAGYQTVFVDIPVQTVEGGVVKLEVLEGKVGRLKISGSRYYSLGHIREGVPELAVGKVPNMPTVQKQLSVLGSESQDRQLTPVLTYGEKPKTLDAEIKVKDELPLHGSLEMNGRNTVGTSYTRLLASLRYDNLWQLNHSVSLQYLVAPEEQDVEVWSGTYSLPLFDSGARLAFYGVGVDSSSAVAAAGTLGVLGTGNVFGMRLTQPLEPIANYFHSVSLGVDYKDFVQGTLLSTSTTISPITYLPFTVGYSGGLRRDDSLTTFGLEGHFSIRGLGNDQQEFEERRYLAQSNYFYFAGNFRHQHKLPGDFGLVLRANGQIADSPLIPNEQLSAGGMYSVRGYHETQELADHGLIGSLELYSPRLAPDDWAFANDLRALTFVDGASLWTMHALPGTPGQASLAGVGVGLRLEFWKSLLGELDWGYPLLRAGLGPGSVKPGNQRIHFRLAYEF